MTILQGTQVGSFKDRDLEVSVSLNQEDGIKQLNEGKRSPVLLTDIKQVAGAGFIENAVVVDEGSHISFSFNSVGPCGYGYKIKTEKEPIVSALYMTNDGSGQRVWGGISRYQDAAKSIRVEDADHIQNETETDLFKRWKATFISWRLLGYKRGSNSYGTARGEVKVDVKKGYIVEGTDSKATFGSISDLSEDDPNSHANGSIIMHFFVFKPGAKVEDVFTVRAAANPNAFE